MQTDEMIKKAKEISARTGRKFEDVMQELTTIEAKQNNSDVEKQLASVGKKKLLKANEACTCQNGRRFIPSKGKWVPCEECERGLKWKVSFDKVKTPDGIDIYDRLGIPVLYRNNLDFRLDILSMLPNATPSKINEVQTFMQSIEDSISIGKVKAVSFYLHIHTDLLRIKGIDIDIKKWVYKTMISAVKSGLSVVPLLSIKQLYDLSVLSGLDMDKISYLEHTDVNDITTVTDISYKNIIELCKLYRVTYQSFVAADICFIEAGADTPKTCWKMLKGLMSDRAKLNLPTYVIGYWSLKTTGHEAYFDDTLNSGRLDLFKTVELDINASKDNTVSIKGNKKYPDTKSSITTGVNAREFMASRD